MKLKRQCWVLGLLLLLPICSFGDDTVFMVHGAVKNPLRLTLAEFQTMPHVTLTVKDHDGHTASYEGVTVEELLRRAGVPQVEALRGDALSFCVLIRAADGYKAVFALAELDSMFTDKRVVLAFRRDGAALDAKAGPLRLLVPDEKRYARWVRQVKDIEVIHIPA
jgi:DMSO/TMAO reductase YedYZ molybdopterin-dependent catalytic subunit